MGRKYINRCQIRSLIKREWGIEAVGTTEEFNGSQGGLWLSAENGYKIYEREIFDYYSEDHKNYDIGVLKAFEKAMAEVGWYAEWNDPGTIMLWKV